MRFRLGSSVGRARSLGSPLVLLTFAATLLESRSASAHDRSVAVSLDGGTCVAHSALRVAVASRGARVADDAPVHLRVKIDPTKDGRVGIVIDGTGAHGAIAERRFVASSCADATDALGLVIALAGDEAERSEAPVTSDAPVEAAPSPAAPVEEAPVVATPAIATPAIIDAPSTRERPTATPPARASSRVAVSAGAVGTTIGEGQVGARIAAALEWERTFLPWIEASASANVPRTIEGGGGGADPVWTVGRVAASPIGFEVARGLRVSAFGAVDAGALTVSGRDAARVDTRTRPWFAFAAGGRARWNAGERWFAGLDVAGVVPLLRDELVFVNGGTAYRVPVAGIESAICLGARFP